jgi:Trypsin-co-occurring domain 1
LSSRDAAKAAEPVGGDRVAHLVEFPLEDGGSVLVEVQEESPERVTRGWGEERVTARAQATFEDSIGKITPAARSMVERLRDFPDPPDEIEVEFGIRLSGEAGAYIATVAAEANFRVSVSWKGPGPGAS